MKGLPVSWLLIGTLVLGAGYFGYKKIDTDYLKPKRNSERYLQFYDGKLPDLDGPKLKTGDARSLQFKVFDLGFGSGKLSQNGDILYTSYGMEPEVTDGTDVDGFKRKFLSLHKPITILRRQNGKQQVIQHSDSFLTPNGHLYEIQDKGEPGEAKFFDGKKIRNSVNSNNLYFQNHLYTEDGILLRSQPELSYSELAFVSNAGDRTNLKIPNSEHLSFAGLSSQLGAIVVSNHEVANASPQVTSILNRSIKQFKLNANIESPIVSPASDTVYVIGTLPEEAQSRLWALQDDTFVAKPIPEKTNRVLHVFAGSKRFCIMVTQVHSAKGKEFYGFPLDEKTYYVDNEYAYDLAQILTAWKITDDARSYSGEVQISANGDLLVYPKGRLYLLQRVK